MADTVLLIHGYGCAGDVWGPVAERLKAEGYRVEAPTIRSAVRTVDGPRAGLAGLTLADYVAEHDVHLGLVAVPGDSAQAVAEQLVEAGVKGILNFAPTRLHVPVGVVNVDLSRSLEMLAFQVTRGLTGEATVDD